MFILIQLSEMHGGGRVNIGVLLTLNDLNFSDPFQKEIYVDVTAILNQVYVKASEPYRHLLV